MNVWIVTRRKSTTRRNADDSKGVPGLLACCMVVFQRLSQPSIASASTNRRTSSESSLLMESLDYRCAGRSNHVAICQSASSSADVEPRHFIRRILGRWNIGQTRPGRCPCTSEIESLSQSFGHDRAKSLLSDEGAMRLVDITEV